ncbi:DUF4112 domain-containing protein [Enterovirga rhinocerotis]|uniref:Uncharacterized protein DUF4112 n=1 Tax=Enterovirga rhinocerotis TaxID=1339210 RepID=A0A4R7BJN3_9HYPH|nr:DUF4112 domain-containing protein [Enterovirga rhinocerotis]TDR85203.1 uncharacterized protein DUF4112 [Enterovirga rhinocerotis]
MAYSFAMGSSFGRAGRAGPIPGLSKNRADTIARLDALSRLLDNAFVVPGTKIRFGLDGVIGLVPGIGDMITTGLSAYLIFEARRLGLPRRAIARMVANLAFDAAIGIVPLVGDAADVMFKANRRNMRILREHLDREGHGARPDIVDAEFEVMGRRR